MKWLLDQGLPRSAADHLRQAGHEAEHVGPLGMATATDRVIVAEASQRQAVIATFDADFHTLLAASGAHGPSVVRIRLEGLKADQVAAILHQVAEDAGDDLKRGAVVSVDARRIRVRPLPIG